MDNIERYPKRIRIDRTTDTGRFYGPFDANRTNGRPDMDSCIYIRADLHRGAVDASAFEAQPSSTTVGLGPENHGQILPMLSSPVGAERLGVGFNNPPEGRNDE